MLYGTYYDVLINVKDTGNEHYVYDVTLTEKEQTTTRTNLLNRSEPVPEPIITPSGQNASDTTKKYSFSGQTHVLEGTELYEELQAAVKAYAETKGEYQTCYDELAKLYYSRRYMRK